MKTNTFTDAGDEMADPVLPVACIVERRFVLWFFGEAKDSLRG